MKIKLNDEIPDIDFYQVLDSGPKKINSKALFKNKKFEAIGEKIDMVDVFRAIEYIPSIVNEAIKIKAKILWTQEGLYSEEVEHLGVNAGLTVVMNQCPKKILEN